MSTRLHRTLLVSAILLASCSSKGGEHAGHNMSSMPARPPVTRKATFTAEDKTSGSAIAFTIKSPEGTTFTDYGIAHTKEMHVIAIRSDLTHFEHLHPTRDKDGLWSVPHEFKDPGKYWIFADFVNKAGEAKLVRLSRAFGDKTTATVVWDKQNLGKTGEKIVKTSGDLSVTVSAVKSADGITFFYDNLTKAGKPVTQQAYLGEKGHSVIIGTNASYRHLHPHKEYVGYKDTDPPRFFVPTLPKGKYRIFTEIKVADVVHTITTDLEV